jgi:serine O-acetyltransferase
MRISISTKELVDLTSNQLRGLFGLGREETVELTDAVHQILEQVEYCFSYNRNKYYHENDVVVFNPFHSGQFTIYLYFLSRHLFCKGANRLLADKVYYLNKALNCVDIYYEVELPAVFGLDHPVGSVIGRGKYSNFFYFTQNCTVGNNHDIYPVFGENVTLLAGAMVVGNSHIGNNCIISANTCIKDQDVPDDSLVFGQSPDLIIHKKDESYFQKNSFFDLGQHARADLRKL